MLHGWIKLHRSILDNWVASEPESLAVWVRLLSEANHKETKKRFNGSLVTIGRGQVVFGLNAFSEKSGVSISKLRRILSELESDGMISRQITSKYSLITVTCFDKYQSDDSQTTSKSQADDNQIASESQHRKNVKNGKNEKKESIDYELVKEIFNSTLTKAPNIAKLTDKRKRLVKKLFTDFELDYEKFSNYLGFLNNHHDTQWMFERRPKNDGTGQFWNPQTFEYFVSEKCFLNAKENLQ